MLEGNKMRFKSTRVFSRENGIIFAFLLLILSIFILSTSDAAARAAESTRLQAASLAYVQSISPLVINEIDYDQPGTDAAEYIELKNVSGAALELDPYQVELVNGSGPSVYLVIDLPAFSLPDGDYYVICANTATVPNCDLDITPDTNLIQNGPPDAVAITLDSVVIEAVSYEGDTGAPYTEGSGVGLVDSGTDINGGISRFPDGTDSDQNNVDLSFRCTTPGAANTADNANCDGTPTPTNTPDGSTPTPTATASMTPTPTATPSGPTPTPIVSGSPLVVNEIDYDQSGTDAAEFVELKNVSESAVDLSEYVLELVNGSDGLPYFTFGLPAFSLPAGDYYVVCADAAMVANCDLDVTPDTNLIQNGAPDAVALRWLVNNQVFDAVSYEGDTAAPYTEGSGLGLEDNSTVQLGISRFPDGVDTHQNNVDLSQRCITPGEANTAENTNCDGSATPTPTPTNTPEPTPTSTPAPATARIYVSSDSAGSIGPLTYGTEDVILFDQGGGFWAMLFDGSDVGLANTASIDAMIFLASGRLIMSFADTTTVPGIGPVASADLVMFVPTSLGNNTAGTFAFIFDGSDVGLDTTGENVDGLALAPSGVILMSTTDSFAVTGGLTGEDEDLIAFIPTSFGPNTSGSWQMYFDGSDVGFDQSPNQDISATWVNLTNTDIYLSPLGAIGPNIGGDDIIVCMPGSLGANTSCLSITFFWNGAGSGLVGNVNSLDIRFSNSPVLEPLGLEP